MNAAPISLGPLDISVNTVEGQIAALLATLERPTPTCVAFANTHLLYCALRDRAFARMLQSFVLLNDGVGISMLANVAANREFPENLNGTDFTPLLLKALPAGARVYLAGAQPDVALACAKHFANEYPHLRICGVCDGYEGAVHGASEVARLKPDVVLAAMGNPQQERWILAASHASGRGLFLGVGALFDFLTQRQRRAPLLWRRMRLEWLHRLACEPARMWRRYSLEIFAVFAAALRQRFSRPA